jgi:hypothetical protein
MVWNLDELLASQIVSFARQNQLGCSLKHFPSKQDKERRILAIELLDHSNDELYPEGRTMFRHLVEFDKDHQMLGQRTARVDRYKSDRQMYVHFLDSMRTSVGIELRNDFEQTWLADPERYPF